MKNIGEYHVKTFPASQLATIDIGFISHMKQYVRALIELDVTVARKLIYEKRRQNQNILCSSLFPASIYPISFTIGSIIKKPGVKNKRVEIREYLYVTVLVDHDIIDGAPAVRALSKLTRLVERGYGWEGN
ncbi:MAG: 2-oxo acid dehydrogenase subunit E2 [Atribacterota bacterium]|nr:2-oxo acid dehydrogenase subunit E2 [Atribacterota bacterium]MDD4896470.1 2-oxo acid dehydrogenase subunit E2 [Atribacterota bacterium]MDD5637273.1 2-oxo acid dehydrogenase subunit E2 [Atribacterota bacterium]